MENNSDTHLDSKGKIPDPRDLQFEPTCPKAAQLKAIARMIPSRQSHSDDQTFKDSPLYKELQALLNRYSVENVSDTPDFILAGFLLRQLDVFNDALNARRAWYNQGDVGPTE